MQYVGDFLSAYDQCSHSVTSYILNVLTRFVIWEIKLSHTPISEKLKNIGFYLAGCFVQ